MYLLIFPEKNSKKNKYQTLALKYVFESVVTIVF